MWNKIIILVLCSLFIYGCQRDSDVASHNLSYKADMFQIDRRIVFYNGVTGAYILVIVGKCSMSAMNRQLEVTCKTGHKMFKKHFLGISDNVTYFAEHLNDTKASVYRHKVLFKPSTIIPDIDMKL